MVGTAPPGEGPLSFFFLATLDARFLFNNIGSGPSCSSFLSALDASILFFRSSAREMSNLNQLIMLECMIPAYIRNDIRRKKIPAPACCESIPARIRTHDSALNQAGLILSLRTDCHQPFLLNTIEAPVMKMPITIMASPAHEIMASQLGMFMTPICTSSPESRTGSTNSSLDTLTRRSLMA